MRKKLIINCRLNEFAMRGPNPHIPYTPDEIADDAARCRDAGASIVHVHARGPEGQPSNSPDLYAEIVAKIRRKSDILIHTTLGNVENAGDAAQRIKHVQAALPDIATIDPGSTNLDRFLRHERRFESIGRTYTNSIEQCMFFAKTMQDLGVKPSLGLWTVSFMRTAEAFLDLGVIDAPALAIIPLCGDGFIAGHDATTEGLQAYFHAEPSGDRLQWCVCSYNANLFPMAALAIARGQHVAPGLGDYQYPELGCPTNADLVARCVALARDQGRDTATPAEAREMLGMRAAA